MIATIINFSTNEAPFLSHCLEEALIFSKQVIVPVCDHFFDGSLENLPLLQGIYAAHPEVSFIQYAWSEKNFYGRHSSHFWHNLSRLIGSFFLKDEIEVVLFLDVDEVVEGARFSKWLQTFPLNEYQALRLACHWYFREAHFRANTVEEAGLIVARSALHYDALMHPEERGGMFHITEGNKIRLVSQEAPFIHHYSWVRNKEALLRKAKTWGHRDERDWIALIEKEFSKPFSGQDFVHGYTFTKVKPYLKIQEYQPHEYLSTNVTLLSTRDIHKIDLALKFGI